MLKGKKFSVCLMNPPFEHNLGDTFLIKTLDICNKVISIQPSNWLFGKFKNKKIIERIKNSYTNIEKYSMGYGGDFDAGIGNELSINVFDLLANKKLIIDDNEIQNDIENISHYETDKLIKEYNNICKKLYSEDNIKNHILEYELKQYVNDDCWCVKIPEIRGHRGKTGPDKDFYTIISNNDEFNNKFIIGEFKDIRKDNIKSNLKYYINLENKQNVLNFLNYVKTDFVRGLLFISKMNIAVANGPTLRYIPWFDFSDSHFSKSPREIDDWLFKKYNISDEIRKHIEEILPDYYGIRK